MHVVAIAVAGLTACADEPSKATFLCEPGTGVAAADVDAIEASVLRGGCASTDVAFTSRFDADESGARPPVLAPGSYGLSCRFFDTRCREIAAGCRDVTLPSDEATDLAVATPAITPIECDGLCVDGVCTDARDGGAADADGVDAGGIDAGVDAGPAVPTSVIDVAPAGRSGAHPAVVWTGTEFAVGLIVAEGSGLDVRVLRLAPGEARDGPLEVIDDGGSAGREDVALASDGASLAVGWSELRAGGDLALMVRVLPGESAASVRSEPIVRQSGLDDAQLFFTDGAFFAAVRAFGSSAGIEALVAGRLGDGMLASPEMVVEGALGEIIVRSTSRGPVAILGSLPAVATRAGGGWEVATITGLRSPLEGDAVELADGALLSAWLHHDAGGEREIAAVRFELGSIGWTPRGTPLPIPSLESDPVLGLGGSHVLVAANVVLGSGDRQLALTWVDGTGSVTAGPCLVPSVNAYSDDPDIACADGWCAITWIEGSAPDGSDFVTRVLQVPADPAAPCP